MTTTLEIGKGKFFDMLGHPDVDDSLDSHGDTTSVTIRCPFGGPYPEVGSIALIVTDGDVDFAGRFMDTSVKFEPTREIFSIKLTNFIDYTQRRIIKKYGRLDTLTGHIKEGVKRSGASGVARRNLLSVSVAGDDGDFFYFDFTRGNLQSFLTELNKQKAFDWRLDWPGALDLTALSNVSGSSNAILKATVTGSVTNLAPKSVVRRPAPGSNPSRDECWWFGLTEQVAIPAASLFSGYGRNGLNRPDNDTGEAHEDVLIHPPSKADQTFYGYNREADRIDQIRVDKPDMTHFFLKKKIFDISNPIPPEGSLEARIRPEEFKFYVNSTDVPEGSIVTVYHSTIYVAEELVDDAAVAAILQGDLDASDGYVEDEIVDEGIVDQPGMIAALKARKSQLARRPVTIVLATRLVDGWRSGQQFQYINDNRPKPINEVLTVISVPRKREKDGRKLYRITASNVRRTTKAEREKEMRDAIRNPKRPRKTQFDLD